MRALVIGASGQVGSALVEALRGRGHDVTAAARTPRSGVVPLDILDTVRTARLIGESEADWIFCPAALTHVDYCEDHRDEAMRVNRDAAALAARAAARHGSGFVYYSTEYVFDGAGGPYAEGDTTNPVSVYGESKLAGERAVQDGNARALIVRTTVVYGPEPQEKNFVYQLLRRGRAGERMRAPIDQISSPTYNVDLAGATVELAERGATGVFHVAGSAMMDRCAFARLVCEVFGLDAALLDAATTADLGQRARRPLRAGLLIDRVRGVITTPLRSPAEGLRAMRAAIG